MMYKEYYHGGKSEIPMLREKKHAGKVLALLIVLTYIFFRPIVTYDVGRSLRRISPRGNHVQARRVTRDLPLDQQHSAA